MKIDILNIEANVAPVKLRVSSDGVDRGYSKGYELSTPFKSLQSAVEFANNMDESYVDIQIDNNLIQEQQILINGSKKRIRVWSEKTISVESSKDIMLLSRESEGVITAVVDEEPLGLIVNGVSVPFSSNHEFSSGKYLYLNNLVKINENTYYFDRPAGITPTTLSNGTYLLVVNRWMCYKVKVIGMDETTITFEGHVMASRIQNFVENGTHFRVVNAYEYLADGTWCYVDNGNGTYTIYYQKPSEEIVETLRIPSQEITLKVEKSCNITFENIRFRNASYKYRDIVNVMAGTDMTVQSDWEVPCCVEVEGSANIVFDRCDFTGCYGYCLWIKNDSFNCKVVNNHIHDTYGGGVKVGIGGYTNIETPDYTNKIVVDNNLIEDFGSHYVMGCGILLMKAHDCHITHNTIHHGYYSGISVGWIWGFSYSYTYNNYIAYNYIHDCMQRVTWDGAGIYMVGKQINTIVEFNKIHDIHSFISNQPAAGIYGDSGSSDILIRYNLIYRTTVSILGFINSSVYNNFLLFPTYCCYYNSLGKSFPTITFWNNIIQTGGKPLSWKYGENALFRRNIIDVDVIKNSIFIGNEFFTLSFRDVENDDFYIGGDMSFGNINTRHGVPRITSREMWTGFIDVKFGVS